MEEEQSKFQMEEEHSISDKKVEVWKSTENITRVPVGQFNV